MNIYGGTDGTTWDLLVHLENLPGDPGSSYTSELMLPETPVSRVKFEVIQGTDTYQPYFALAEIEFYEVVRELIDPETE